MECSYFLFLTFLLWLAIVARSKEAYTLTHHRQGDKLILECCPTTSQPHEVRFWIRHSKIMDLLTDLPPNAAAAQISQNKVSFQLQSEFDDSVFSCGDNNGGKSAELGPFTGNYLLLLSGGML